MSTPTLTVLVVEDEDSFVEALTVGLKREGFHARRGRPAPAGRGRARPPAAVRDGTGHDGEHPCSPGTQSPGAALWRLSQ